MCQNPRFMVVSLTLPDFPHLSGKFLQIQHHSCSLPDQPITSIAEPVRHTSRHHIDFPSLLQGHIHRNQCAAFDSGFNHHHHICQTADNTVSGRKILGTRRRSTGIRGKYCSLLYKSFIKPSVLDRVTHIHAAAEHTHTISPCLQGRLLADAVNPPGHAADHRYAPASQCLPQQPGHMPSVLRTVPGANDRRSRHILLGKFSPEKQSKRSIGNGFKSLRVTLLPECQKPNPLFSYSAVFLLWTPSGRKPCKSLHLSGGQHPAPGLPIRKVNRLKSAAQFPQLMQLPVSHSWKTAQPAGIHLLPFLPILLQSTTQTHASFHRYVSIILFHQISVTGSCSRHKFPHISFPHILSNRYQLPQYSTEGL